ncbi:polymorphic toxin type 27 domain-containing protein [Streptomyces sp. NPDC059982]|uniref:polymorphic toxin type 27 domain-containing protein n=1 Tax=unclassified Streptomyces TaxID=2593676 RepID=UPI0036BADA02
MGLGERPIWTVGVERSVASPNVRLSVSLDGVPGAKNADEALTMLLLQRGETISNSDWRRIRTDGFGTAWEMIKIRTALRMEQRTWTSIEWYVTNSEGKIVRVFPTRLTYADGTPVS